MSRTASRAIRFRRPRWRSSMRRLPARIDCERRRTNSSSARSSPLLVGRPAPRGSGGPLNLSDRDSENYSHSRDRPYSNRQYHAARVMTRGQVNAVAAILVCRLECVTPPSLRSCPRSREKFSGRRRADPVSCQVSNFPMVRMYLLTAQVLLEGRFGSAQGDHQPQRV